MGGFVRSALQGFGGLLGRGGAVGLVHGVRRLGRHVVLVVLGEHLAGLEDAVGADLPLRDDAFAFLEEVGRMPL